MTTEEYWDVYYRSMQGTLTPQEQQRFRFVGLLAESRAREQGQSLIPECMNPGLPVEQLELGLLMAIGMIHLALSAIESK